MSSGGLQQGTGRQRDGHPDPLVGNAPAAAPASGCAAAAVADAIVTIEDSTVTSTARPYTRIAKSFEDQDGHQRRNREVARIIPGVLERIEVTELEGHASGAISANCDAEMFDESANSTKQPAGTGICTATSTPVNRWKRDYWLRPGAIRRGRRLP